MGYQSALCLGESFCLEGTANVIGIDKPAAMCDRKIIGILGQAGRLSSPFSGPYGHGNGGFVAEVPLS